MEFCQSEKVGTLSVFHDNADILKIKWGFFCLICLKIAEDNLVP